MCCCWAVATSFSLITPSLVVTIYLVSSPFLLSGGAICGCGYSTGVVVSGGGDGG